MSRLCPHRAATILTPKTRARWRGYASHLDAGLLRSLIAEGDERQGLLLAWVASKEPIEDEKLIENAATRGTQMLAGLKKIAAGRSAIGDVRGLGLMLALEFVKPGEGDGRVPDPDAVKRVIAEANKRKMLLLSAGAYAQVIRIIPPLITTAEEVDLALKILEESLDAAGVKRS